MGIIVEIELINYIKKLLIITQISSQTRNEDALILF